MALLLALIHELIRLLSMSPQNEKAIQILRAWHRVEFFQTYSVPGREDSELSPVNIGVKEFNADADKLLPWLNPLKQPKSKLDSEKTLKYTLYLGLFDKAVLCKIVEQSKLQEPDGFCKDEIEQRLDSEGLSCFAKLNLDENGMPLWDSFSVSTLPWAIGQLLNDRVEDLSFAKFTKDCELLDEWLSRIESKLMECAFDSQTCGLDALGISKLISSLYQWAGLQPNDLALSGETPDFLFQIAFYQVYENKKKQVSENASSVEKNKEKEGGNDDEELPEQEASQIPILNSFYIQDIERAINCISTGKAGKGLMQYLGDPPNRYDDLYGGKALSLIADRLAPGRTPEGRWPSNPGHNMSLMQQFSVNTVFKELKEEGLLSVNGPPGTGKTTLLRDIIAQNVVERAKVLAALADAGAGLTIEGNLIEPLTGFEMVVASSNNAAVENVSKELPQRKSIDKKYYDQCRYFEPVANQLAARESKKGELLPIIKPEERAWGIVSAVMGAKEKRKEFARRFFFHNHRGKNHKEQPSEREHETNFLNFWKFKEEYKKKGLSFEAAKQSFNKAIERVESFNGYLKAFEELNRSFEPEAYQEKITAIQADIENFQEKESEIIKNRSELTQKQEVLEAECSVEEIALEKIRLERPGFFACLFNPARNKAYKKKFQNHLFIVEKLKRRLSELMKTTQVIKNDLALNEATQKELSAQKNTLKLELKQKQEALESLRERLGECKQPSEDQRISDPEVQRHAYWQCKQINDLRSEVFIAAMQLHEAWLIEASKITSFRKRLFRISDVVKGILKEKDDSQPIWQILFMFVPVISTTFASLGRMFTHLDEKSLGWLMIDEAGQAIPQAAIGGLMRAKRTIVVGDPLQIEPVFIAQPRLVEHVMSSLLEREQKKWSPNTWSVQQLADRVNPYGCALKVMEKEMWIGIPLWVHRRCIDPMFGISNAIAYDHRMIHGNADVGRIPVKSHPELGENRWIESLGKCTKKQYKQELAEDTLVLLLNVAKQKKTLENIYIITPFKLVKQELKAFLLKNKNQFFQIPGYQETNLSAFLKNNVGTIHTFQGKENKTVILVLGCDRENNGGAVWAASKPNLLNVAVTRAKQHLFVVGDSQVWGGQKYFDMLNQVLAKGESCLFKEKKQYRFNDFQKPGLAG